MDFRFFILNSILYSLFFFGKSRASVGWKTKYLEKTHAHIHACNEKELNDTTYKADIYRISFTLTFVHSFISQAMEICSQ